MAVSDLFVQSTDPAVTIIVWTITSEHMMYVVDQIRSAAPIKLIVCPHEQFNEVADCKCISSKIPPLLLRRGI
jgi:hypothetical protein